MRPASSARFLSLSIALCLVAPLVQAETLTLTPPPGGSIQWQNYAYSGGMYSWSAWQICGATAAGFTNNCTVTLGKGAVIRLKAVPYGQSTFQGWTGVCSGTGMPGYVFPSGANCEVTLIDNWAAGATIPCASGTILVDGKQCATLTPWNRNMPLTDRTKIALREVATGQFVRANLCGTNSAHMGMASGLTRKSVFVMSNPAAQSEENCFGTSGPASYKTHLQSLDGGWVFVNSVVAETRATSPTPVWLKFRRCSENGLVENSPVDSVIVEISHLATRDGGSTCLRSPAYNTPCPLYCNTDTVYSVLPTHYFQLFVVTGI